MITLMSDVAEKLQSMALEVLRIDAPASFIQSETNLYELGLDSLNVVEMLTHIEMNFDFTVDAEDMDAALFGRFGNLVEFVQSKLAARA